MMLLRKQPVSVGYLPVWNRARQGPHTGWGEKALSNFTPSRARASRLGVNRGLKDVLFFCVDGLVGFKEAISAVYPQAQIQRCVIHMLRNSFKYVNYSDLKKFSNDFKAVYNAPNEAAALSELEGMKEKWGKKYPYAISNWENNWEDVSSFFQFSEEIRRIMYTTNIIEALNRQYRKVTKTKSVFPNDQSLEKMLYLASENITKKWTQRYRGWDQVLNQLIVLYGERLTQYL